MTVVFDDAIYTAVKIAAARRNQPVKKLVCQALKQWLEAQEDAELLSQIEAAMVLLFVIAALSSSKSYMISPFSMTILSSNFIVGFGITKS